MEKQASVTLSLGKDTAGRRVAISQSNYIPWKGYFDLIRCVDEFILYDDVQYTRRDWRNRNRIKTHNGVRWLTIPVVTKGNYYAKIKEIRVTSREWAKNHYRTILTHYAQTPYLQTYKDWLADLYLNCSSLYLHEINRRFIEAICKFLGITTTISSSSDYALRLEADATERLVDLCRQVGARHYLCGPAAKSYLQESLFTRNGIAVAYMDYSGYPEYPQLYPPFEHSVSMMDLLLNTGPEARDWMKEA